MEEVSFILSHKSWALAIVLSLVIAAGCVYIKILREEVTTANAEKTVIVTDLAVSQESVKALQASIIDQNTAITKLQADAVARVAAHQAEITLATRQAATYKQQAADLMNIVANPKESKCEAVNDIINSQLNEAIQ